MKILLSAYACSPGLTSEPGVGWRWACALAEEHQVVVLTHTRFRPAIEAEMARQTRPSVSVVYHDSPLASAIPFNRWTAIPKYALWQCTVMPLARRLDRLHDFDLVWHITMGTFRYPSWLGLLGKPLVFGPVGGGERAPLRLLASLPLRVRCAEYARDLMIRSGRFDPFLWFSLSKAATVFVKTASTAAALPGKTSRRCVELMEIGVDATDGGTIPDRTLGAAFRLLFVARLLGWKGAHLALGALASLHERGLPAQLQIVGDGPLRTWLEGRADQLGVRQHVEFSGSIPHAGVLTAMERSHCFLFPSLHDSSGNVVLEAMSRGLPVVCLDLGGPACLVADDWGRVVASNGRDETAVACGLADAVEPLIRDEALRHALGRAARERARTLTWHGALHTALRTVTDRVPNTKGEQVKPHPH